MTCGFACDDTHTLCCQAFYEKRFRGRRLTWNFELSRADVRANFDKAYELQVTTSQLAVMLIYNDNEKASLQDIARVTGKAPIEAAQVCYSLLLFAKSSCSVTVFLNTDDSLLSLTDLVLQAWCVMLLLHDTSGLDSLATSSS